jgi:glycosyltransferase involved in cell wall biosynthesis
MMTIDKPLVSIVTVVFNGEEFLEETIQSVINQSYNNIEYIIIDGGSTDNTVEIIKKYENRISHWISEKDSGIYDAMNKGINIATGGWINFMNAGDVFYSNQVVKEVFDNQKYEAEIVYGNYLADYGSFTKKVIAKGVEKLWQGMVFCHQSTFVNAQYHKKHKYSLQYSIAGDFNFFYSAFKNKARFQHIDKVVSIFACDGISSVVGAGAGRQNLRIVNSYGYDMGHNLYYFARFSYQIIKRVLSFLLFNRAK